MRGCRAMDMRLWCMSTRGRRITARAASSTPPSSRAPSFTTAALSRTGARMAGGCSCTPSTRPSHPPSPVPHSRAHRQSRCVPVAGAVAARRVSAGRKLCPKHSAPAEPSVPMERIERLARGIQTTKRAEDSMALVATFLRECALTLAETPPAAAGAVVAWRNKAYPTSAIRVQSYRPDSPGDWEQGVTND